MRRRSASSREYAPRICSFKLRHYSDCELYRLSHISKTVLSIVEFGGAEGIRTPDPLNAIEVLSQLSYSPMQSPMDSEFSRLTGSYQ